MQFPHDFDLRPRNVLKIVGLILIVIVVIALSFRLIGSAVNSLGARTGLSISQEAPVFNESYYAKGVDSYEESASAVGLSLRNVSPSIPPSPDGPTVGDNAEEFEVTEYNANIETRYLENVCGEIAALKSRADVIFERANEYEKSCSYGFKVKRESVAGILEIIKELNPKELNENTYTIKRLIDDYTSELEILENKMNSIEETLSNAVKTYDDITKIATKVQDVESLAKIIDSKINIIEKLTQERIKINSQMEQLERSKAEQLDRLNYTYFNVYILENKFVDWQNIKDSWVEAVKAFVRDINGVLQDITVNLVALMFSILQYAVYLFIVLLVAKYGWRLIKYVWKK